MTTADILIESRPTLAPSDVSEIWLGHLVSLLIPLTTLAFVWTGPHAWYVALLFIAPLAVYQWIDTRPHYEYLCVYRYYQFTTSNYDNRSVFFTFELG